MNLERQKISIYIYDFTRFVLIDSVITQPTYINQYFTKISYIKSSVIIGYAAYVELLPY